MHTELKAHLVTTGDILLVSELFPPAIGGTAELFGNVYSRLRGTQTSVLTNRSAAGTHRPSAPFRGIRERRMRPRHWGLLHPDGLINHALIAADIRRMARARVTAVHCGRVLPEGLSALFAFASGGSPYACWVHGEELAYIDTSRELRRLAAFVFGRARAVFANSANTARLLVGRGVPGGAIHVVRPGVDADRFRPSAAGADSLRRELAGDGQIICLTVGRLQRRKGHDLVLEALAEFGSRVSGIRYVIVGDGEERPRLESLVRRMGLESVVVLKGRVEADDLPRYYAAADLFVHPNRADENDFEGFGIVFLEAAACGLPAIAGRSGGVPEAIAEGETGLLVSGTDAVELRNAMLTLIDDPERRRTMGLAARARILREFTWERAANQISLLHRQLFG